MATNGTALVLLTCNCDYCFAPFVTVSHRARFCSTRCKNAHWQATYKRFALVELFMAFYRLSERARRWVLLAVTEAEAKCYEVARLLGYRYSARKRSWVKA